MIILIQKKTLRQNLTSIQGKNSQQVELEIEGTYLNIIKITCDKSTTTITLNDEKLKASSKTKNKTRMLTLTTPIQHST